MNISFGEILVILLVALLVIKPERLPETAMLLGRCLKWLREMGGRIKEDMEEYFLLKKNRDDEH